MDGWSNWLMMKEYERKEEIEKEKLKERIG